MKKTIIILLAILNCQLLFSQSNPGDNIAYKVKREAFNNSKIDDYAQFLTDYLGPRLAGSKLMTRSEQLVADELKQLGLDGVRVEKAMDFPKGGWDNVKTYAAMTFPYYTHFFALPKAWSGSTNGLVKSDVILLDIEKEEDLEKFIGKLNVKIVLYP